VVRVSDCPVWSGLVGVRSSLPSLRTLSQTSPASTSIFVVVVVVTSDVMLMTFVTDVIMSCDADILTSLFRVSNFVVVVVSSLGIVPVRVFDCRKPGNDHIEQQRTQIIERSIAQDRYLERVTAHGRLNISVLCSVFSSLPVTP